MEKGESVLASEHFLFNYRRFSQRERDYRENDRVFINLAEMGNTQKKARSAAGSMESTNLTAFSEKSSKTRTKKGGHRKSDSKLFKTYSEKDSFERKIEQRLKLRVSKFYNYIHETSKTAALHKIIESREIYNDPRKEMVPENVPEIISKMEHLRTWKPYLIEKLEEMDTHWAKELVKEVQDIHVHDSHWQEEFFWKQSYNSLVLAPRQHRLSKASVLTKEKPRVSKNPFAGQSRPPLTIKEKALEEAAILIEKQIQHKQHPFFTILKHFQQKFSSEYLQYCCGATSIMSRLSTRNIVMNGFSVGDPEGFEEVSRRAIIHLREFVRILYLTIIKYYQINVVRSHNREIIIDKMTACIMKDQVYSTVYLLLLKKNEPQIQKLSCIMEKLNGITLAELKISKYFQFDLDFREGFELKEEIQVQEEVANEPFIKSIRAIADIKKIEQPTQKLEHIYGLNKTIISEIDSFWANYKIKPKNLAIDTDNLLGVYIFVILKSKFPQILVEIEIANQFLTNIAKLSNKGFFLATLQTSLEYILQHLEDDLQREKQDQRGDNSNEGISFSKVLDKDRSSSKESMESRPRYFSFQNEEENKAQTMRRSQSLGQLETGDLKAELEGNELRLEKRKSIELNEEGKPTRIQLGHKTTQQLHVTIMNNIETAGFRNSRMETETGSFCLKQVN